MPTWALIPVKERARAKQRLADVLAPIDRECLFEAMLRDVISAVTTSRCLDGFVVVTVDPGVAELARLNGGLVLETGARAGHNAATLSGLHALSADHAARTVITLPMDIPLVTAQDIDGLLDEHRCTDAALTLVPAQDLAGTNVIVASPPTCLAPSFGHDSFVLHKSIALQAGIRTLVSYRPNLALDLDTARDLDAFLEIDSNTCTRSALVAMRRVPAPPLCGRTERLCG